MQRKWLIILVLAFMAVLSGSGAWAHPHVFVYTSVNVVFDEKGLAGFQLRWRFDEMFSSTILLDFDRNGNKSFEPPEIEKLKADAFANLCHFNYFTHIKINGRNFKVQFVKDFSAAIEKDRLVYQFFVPCHVSALDTFKKVQLSVYDHTFYCSVFWVNNPVAYQNHALYAVEHRIARNKAEAYYYGQIYPDEITLRFKRKNG